MSNGKILPSFIFDLLKYLNREQLERISIVCRRMNNLIHRYFHSSPYRVFDQLVIFGGSYALFHNYVQWHPNQGDYTVHQFLEGQQWMSEKKRDLNDLSIVYSFAETRPYLSQSIRIKDTYIVVGGKAIDNTEQIEEMESIMYLWRAGCIHMRQEYGLGWIGTQDFLPIFNSQIVWHCDHLSIDTAHFSFKDYKVLYALKILEVSYNQEDEIDSNYWPEFLDKPGVKPVVVLWDFGHENINITLDHLKEAFSSAVLPNAFQLVFAQREMHLKEFKGTNKNVGEKLHLTRGLPVECQANFLQDYANYTLERSTL